MRHLQNFGAKGKSQDQLERVAFFFFMAINALGGTRRSALRRSEGISVCTVFRCQLHVPYGVLPHYLAIGIDLFAKRRAGVARGRLRELAPCSADADKKCPFYLDKGHVVGMECIFLYSRKVTWTLILIESTY